MEDGGDVVTMVGTKMVAVADVQASVAVLTFYLRPLFNVVVALSQTVIEASSGLAEIFFPQFIGRSYTTLPCNPQRAFGALFETNVYPARNCD